MKEFSEDVDDLIFLKKQNKTKQTNNKQNSFCSGLQELLFEPSKASLTFMSFEALFVEEMQLKKKGGIDHLKEQNIGS